MTSTPAESAAPGTWWRCWALGPDGRPRWFAVVASTRHPDRTDVELTEAEARRQVGDDAECVAHFDAEGRVVRVEPGPRFSDDARTLWLVVSTGSCK